MSFNLVSSILTSGIWEPELAMFGWPLVLSSLFGCTFDYRNQKEELMESLMSFLKGASLHAFSGLLEWKNSSTQSGYQKRPIVSTPDPIARLTLTRERHLPMKMFNSARFLIPASLYPKGVVSLHCICICICCLIIICTCTSSSARCSIALVICCLELPILVLWYWSYMLQSLSFSSSFDSCTRAS